MTLHEFDLIKKYFQDPSRVRADVTLGVGDDAALVSVPDNHELAITTDTLIAGVHFPAHTSAYDIGHKALAVNLSDLAAMGAAPAWVTLALTLPEANESWLKAFSEGFFSLANRYDVQLIGGDTTRGALSITIAVYGLIPTGMALRRDQAKPGDLIYVTNTLGDAGLVLKLHQKEILPHKLLEKFYRPEPQILIGEKLRAIASSAIDISDGLAADLTHILDSSHVGATVDVEALPLSDTLRQSLSSTDAIQLALTAGDDYELCFTVPKTKQQALEKNLHGFSYTRIGTIMEKTGLELTFRNGEKYALETKGYQHF